MQRQLQVTMKRKRSRLLGPIRSAQTQEKPGILVVSGDVIGGFNISAYNHDMMG